MLNIKGAYVVIGSKEPFAVLLGADADALLTDRIGAVGYDKAIKYTFGHEASNALPCTLACMETIALEFKGSHEMQVRQLCARIALGEPIGNGKDYGDQGGQHARIDAPTPRPSSPAEVLAQHGFESRS
jgi:hypothetical protein